MTKILVAEDERDIRELIGFTLRFAGFEVVLAVNGIEAVEKAPLEQPDLIMLDVRMPKMTGYEACRRLKENPETSDIPIVFLSAKGQEGDGRVPVTDSFKADPSAFSRFSLSFPRSVSCPCPWLFSRPFGRPPRLDQPLRSSGKRLPGAPG